jgi:hypothetical protein
MTLNTINDLQNDITQFFDAKSTLEDSFFPEKASPELVLIQNLQF